MARAILELIGDADSLLRSFRKSSEAADKFGGHLKELSVTAEQSARAQVEAAVKRDARLRGEIATYRQVASAAKHGSREQIAAANLATRGEERLSRSLAITSREAKAHARSIAGAERELGRFGRGAAAGSGLARSLGRSLAFASGGFLVFASVTQLLRKSIDAATEDAAVQRQLAAQFKASGLELGTYKQHIVDATLATSRLSGFTETELTQAFTRAFRGTQNVAAGLKVQAVAADAARGTGKDLGAITIGLTKAYLGQVTALRRLGIQVPTNLKGMAALAFVARRFAGQAQAGTTAQQRFAAALHNTEISIGSAILPSLTKYLDKATVWLDNSEHQAEIQRTMARVIRTTGNVIRVTGEAFGIAAKASAPFIDAMRTMIGLGRTLNTIFKKSRWFVAPEVMLALKAAGLAKGLLPGRGPGTLGRGTSPLGENALGGGGQAAVVPAARAAGPLGFKARFANAEIALARAQLTKTQADDRKILKLEAELLRERIKTLGTARKTLAERTQLTQQLVGIEGQITSIDQQAATARKTSSDKRLAALTAEKTAADKELSALKQRDKALAGKIKQIQASFQSAVTTAREGIGALFAGPVLNFSDEQRKAALGIPNTAADPKALVRDLRGQVQAEAARQRNINKIQKRLGLGRNARLITELRSNPADATEVAALAGSDKGTLRAFAKQFAGRERLAQTIARADMRVGLANLHVAQLRLRSVRAQENHFTIYIDGIEQKQAKVRVKQSAAQRRGPVPGRS